MNSIEVLAAVIAAVLLFASGLYCGLVMARACIREREEQTYTCDSPIPVDWFIE